MRFFQIQMRKFSALLLSTCLLAVSGCKDGRVDNKVIGGAPISVGGGTTTAAATVSSYFSGISGGGATAVARAGNLPTANGGPTCAAPPAVNVVNGGTSRITLTGSSAFSRVLCAASNTAVAAPSAGAPAPDISGYYELILPAAVTSVVLEITNAQTNTDRDFNCVFALIDAGGLIGTPANTAATLTQVGTGDVQVSLSWDSVVDMDLYVVDPAGEEIYYGHKTAASGGTLDLDSNVGCTGVQNENTTWPTGTAPNGTYIVRVNLYSSCSIATATNITVTVNAKGTTRTFTATRGPTATPGTTGAGTEVTRFTVSATGVSFAAPSPVQGPYQPALSK